MRSSSTMEDVFGGVAIADAASDESEQRGVELLPDARRVDRPRALGGHRHPQASVCVGVQHSSFAVGSQQDSARGASSTARQLASGPEGLGWGAGR